MPGRNTGRRKKRRYGGLLISAVLLAALLMLPVLRLHRERTGRDADALAENAEGESENGDTREETVHSGGPGSREEADGESGSNEDWAETDESPEPGGSLGNTDREEKEPSAESLLPDQHEVWIEAFDPTADGGESGNLILDLNFDGYADLCIRSWFARETNVPYACLLYDTKGYEYSVTLYDVKVNPERKWIVSGCRTNSEDEYARIYCRYDERNQLYLLRYSEEDATGIQLQLYYAEGMEDFADIPLVDQEETWLTMVNMAKQALEEIYRWTGQRVRSACFFVSGDTVYFARTQDDMQHSRTYFSRSFGADTEYNRSGYEKSISSIHIASRNEVWYSMLDWKKPKNAEEMSDEEIIIWYFHWAMEGPEILQIRKEYEDTWTVQTAEDSWYEVIYNSELQEISCITGPYPTYPEH